ncbi:MAG: single-stranded DNA-binding protein [Clostridia bacterium]|jgi:single-strand DNA-binding protein|nr:single-stranded DNA-binding protein [Clostridia bacterium]
MLNCAVIMGRLTADPELRTTTSGVSVTSFTVAVDRNYQKAGTERQTDFINVVAWRQTAEFVSRYFHKGSMIAVQGSIQTRNYEDRNGNKRTAVEIVADNVSFTGSKAETGTGAPQGQAYTQAAPAAAPAAPAASFSTAGADDFSSLDTDDDLPF